MIRGRELGTATKLVAYAGVLGIAFGGGAIVGATIGPEPDDRPTCDTPACVTTTSEPIDHGGKPGGHG